MSRKKKSEDEEAMALDVPVEIEETPEEETPEANALEESEPTQAEPVAYIGPSIKHIAVSGTVYKSGLPVRLEKKIEEIPAIKGLLVPISKLAESRKSVKAKDTALYNLYQTVKEKL